MTDPSGAREQIYQVLARYCRGVDRLDLPLVRSCWHDDGTDSRPPLFEGTADEFIEWLPVVLADASVTVHRIHNWIADVDGDRAHVETYWSSASRFVRGDDLVDVERLGRYLDVFERRSERWAILRRRALTDWSRASVVSSLSDELQGAVLKGRTDRPVEVPSRSRLDPSYELFTDGPQLLPAAERA